MSFKDFKYHVCRSEFAWRKTEYTHVRGGFLGTVVEFKETGKKIVFSVDEMCMEQALGEHWSKRVKTWPTFDDFMHEFKITSP